MMYRPGLKSCQAEPVEAGMIREQPAFDKLTLTFHWLKKQFKPKLISGSVPINTGSVWRTHRLMPFSFQTTNAALVLHQKPISN
jgi:hypothetical protein